MKEKFIADRITELRIRRDISEYKLSYELGQSKTYIGMITSGRAYPSVSMLLEICDYFEMTPAEFFAPYFDSEAQMLVELFQTLNGDNKFLVTKIIETLIYKQEMEKNEEQSRDDG